MTVTGPTGSARLCFKKICDIAGETLKCGGNIKESPDWLCNMCPMHYYIDDDDYRYDENTGCYVKDMVKHFDWIDNDFYLVAERNAENGEHEPHT